MIFQIIHASHLQDNKIIRFQCHFLAHGSSFLIGAAIALQIYAVIHNGNTMGRNAFVLDQGLTNRLADADDAITPAEHQAVEQHPFAAGIVGEMTAVFREQNGGPWIEKAGGYSVKERRILVGVNEANLMAT